MRSKEIAETVSIDEKRALVVVEGKEQEEDVIGRNPGSEIPPFRATIDLSSKSA